MAPPLPETKLLNKSHNSSRARLSPQNIYHISCTTLNNCLLFFELITACFICAHVCLKSSCVFVWKTEARRPCVSCPVLNPRNPAQYQAWNGCRKGNWFTQTHTHTGKRELVFGSVDSQLYIFCLKIFEWFEEAGFSNGVREILWLLLVQPWDFIQYISNASWHFPWATRKKER